jgi:hypothetical protein
MPERFKRFASYHRAASVLDTSNWQYSLTERGKPNSEEKSKE